MPIRSYGPYAAVKNLLLSLHRVFSSGGKKVTKSEKEFRVQAVYGMLVDGKAARIFANIVRKLGEVSERTGDHYIADARQRLKGLPNHPRAPASRSSRWLSLYSTTGRTPRSANGG